VFEGRGSVVLGDVTHTLEKGDLFVVPSWVPWSLQAESEFDLFRFSDAPIVERLHFARTWIPERVR
jgi:gentisate 1,2-dioxygenase